MISLARCLALVVLSLLTMEAVAQDDEPERLRIHGSNLVGDRLMPALVEDWLRSIGYQQIKRRELGAARTQIGATRDGQRLLVDIEKRGTGSGLAALVEGEAEIAMTSRQPNAEEIDAAWQLGDLRSPAQEWVLGIDGLVVLVAPGNGVRELGIAQLASVVSGKSRNWKELGGHDAPIRLHVMARGTGTDELLSQLVLRGAAVAKDATRHGTYAEVVAAATNDPGSIAVVGLRAPRGKLQAIAIRSGGRVAFPDRLSISTEDYPLQRRIYLHTGQLITALGRGLALYAVSNAGQSVVARSSFIPLNLLPMPAQDQHSAPAEYQQIVAKAERLPVTVRFGRGLDFLDSRSRQDMDRLAEFMALPQNRKRRLVLAGFANPQPRTPYQSLSLSQERVDYVSSELLAMRMKVVTVRGFGGSMNLVDADQPSARYRNDRVEVWLR